MKNKYFISYYLNHIVTGIFCLILFCFIYSCSSPDYNRLEMALEFAGENRIQLEKVLDHYQEDPEKLAAATFLIENMPRWYGYEGKPLDSIYAVLQRRCNGIPIPDKERDQWKSFPFYSLPKVYDAHVITADYLIENIELAFAVKEKYPWNHNLSYEDFCEYLLPYRIGDEPLSNWRKLYYDDYTAFLDTTYQGSDVVEACNALARELKRIDYMWNDQFTLPYLSGEYLYHTRIGYCRDACSIAWYAMRASGIPVAIDQYIWSPEYQTGHTWNVVRDTTGYFLPFWFSQFEAKRSMEDDGRKKGKVYRSQYGMQPEKYKGISFMESVPALFRDRFIADVSENYWQNRAVVPVNKENEKFAYLGVFSPRGWIPIDMGEIKKGKVTFRNLEEKVIYQPLYSDEHKHRPAGYPFLFDKGEIYLFEPDRNQMKTIEMDRKMSLTDVHIRYMNLNVLGSRIEGSNRKDFSDAQLLWELKDSIFISHNEVTPLLKGPFRYFRYVAPPEKIIELAELFFYEDSLSTRPIPLQVSNLIPETQEVTKLIDGDILSYYHSPVHFPTAEFDAGIKKQIEKIVFYPRNDDNFIREGELYELFYQDGTNGWISLGKEKATGATLTYKVPKNAVLWLRNLTKGKEEQIFICKDGKQLFVRNM